MRFLVFLGSQKQGLLRNHAFFFIVAWLLHVFPPPQVKRCEGNNDKVKYLVLLCGDSEDVEVAKAAAGALAMLTAISNIICRKVYTVKKGYDFPVPGCYLPNYDFPVLSRYWSLVIDIPAGDRKSYNLFYRVQYIRDTTQGSLALYY